MMKEFLKANKILVYMICIVLLFAGVMLTIHAVSIIFNDINQTKSSSKDIIISNNGFKTICIDGFKFYVSKIYNQSGPIIVTESDHWIVTSQVLSVENDKIVLTKC